MIRKFILSGTFVACISIIVINLYMLENNLPTLTYAQNIIPSTSTEDIFAGDASHAQAKDQVNVPHL
jgi:hypothetical protein